MANAWQVLNIPSLQRLQQFYLAQYLWGAPFEVMDNKLVEHREKTINKIFKIPRLPSSLQIYLKRGIILLEQAYNQLFQWTEIYCTLNLLNVNESYLAARYFTVEGHFNDVAWVKRFIHDTEIWIVRRFNFACLYCFEDDIRMLWQQIKDTGEEQYDTDIGDNDPSLVFLWIQKLENKFDIQSEDPDYNVSSFWYQGFVVSVMFAYEQATYYFWQHLSDSVKIDIIENGVLFTLMSVAACRNYYKIVYFLYTQFSYERKSDGTFPNVWNIPEVWCCLLKSPFTHTLILQEILEFPYPLSSQIQGDLLLNLAYNLNKLKLDIFKNAFEMLWQKTSEKDRLFVFENRCNILTTLVNAKEIDTAGLIIKEMSAKQKEKCLLDDLTGYGCNNLDTLCAQGEYDLLHHYMSFFLIYFDRTTHTEVVREDSFTVLESFVLSPIFNEWIKGLHETGKREVNKILDSLQNSLKTINQLLNNIEGNSLTMSSNCNEYINELEPVQKSCSSIPL